MPTADPAKEVQHSEVRGSVWIVAVVAFHLDAAAAT
jgi:hypothetical protein